MEGDVFFEPLVTLFLAIMTVTILVSYNRISQVLPSITQLFVDSTNPKYILKVFLSLPKPIQSTMLQTLRIGYPDMPEMTMKNLKEKKKKKKKKACPECPSSKMTAAQKKRGLKTAEIISKRKVCRSGMHRI
mmetsp:Transcript_18081/g.21325  ORF Transcript_18081/g.21325 Transcript_18081/m.21325 type:complete len:132 (+) Transcript_18081:374-769(+)